jgi:hypothetical protein
MGLAGLEGLVFLFGVVETMVEEEDGGVDVRGAVFERTKSRFRCSFHGRREGDVRDCGESRYRGVRFSSLGKRRTRNLFMRCV